MKKSAFLLALGLSALSCTYKMTKQEKKQIYKIEGFVELNNKKHEAVWYTDTVYFLHDTICYDNSDGSKVRIAPPYTLNKHEQY